jgi:hypothetical protein
MRSYPLRVREEDIPSGIALKIDSNREEVIVARKKRKTKREFGKGWQWGNSE